MKKGSLFKRSPRKTIKGPKAPKMLDAALRPGHRFEGEVRDLSSNGQGVVTHPGGRVFFVPGVWRGERGLFEIDSLKGRMGFARMVSLSEHSPGRRSPACPHHGFAEENCGGCPWLFMDYEEQLQRKELRVQAMLQTLNTGVEASTIWPSPEEFGYRNRAQFKSDGRQLGYVAGGSREIAPITDCLVLNEKNRHTLSSLRSQLPNKAWKPTGAKRWTVLHVDDAIGAEQVAINERRPFRQGNSAQNLRMRDWLQKQILDLQGPATVLELFAGSGNFTEVLVTAGCQSIVAVDSFRPAVEALRRRSLAGVTALCSDLGRSSSANDIKEALSVAQLLLLDPPREGLKNISDYLALAPQLHTIIYISCDLATLTRDLQIAMEHNFCLQQAQPLDLFPQTPHIEVLTVLRRPRQHLPVC